MGHYTFVKPGDQFRPSAKLENEVRRFFNGGATISGGKSKAGSTNNIRISAMNETDTAIPSGAAVAIYHNDEKDYFYIELATATDDFWGITVGIIPPDSSGTVVVSGIVNALISPGDGDFVVPNNGVLMRSTSGNARVLYGGNFANDAPGMVLLGGASGGDYNGYFKLIAFPDGDGLTVYIVNGAEFNLNGINGIELGTNLCRINNQYYDVPGNYIEIPNLAEGETKTIYLVLSWGNNNVAFTYTAEIPADGTAEASYIVLGRVSLHGIYQDSYGIPQILWFSPCVGYEENWG